MVLSDAQPRGGSASSGSPAGSFIGCGKIPKKHFRELRVQLVRYLAIAAYAQVESRSRAKTAMTRNMLVGLPSKRRTIHILGRL